MHRYRRTIIWTGAARTEAAQAGNLMASAANFGAVEDLEH